MKRTGRARAATSAARDAGPDLLPLPAPSTGGGPPLDAMIARRRSERAYADDPLDAHALSQLLWAAQGVTDREGLRAAPSAGALYPLELYVVTAGGLFHYEPDGHLLRRTAGRDLRMSLRRAALDQEMISRAPATFVFAAVMQRMSRKYGTSRSPRYVHFEVGHAAQNLMLEAVGLGLGSVAIGAFDDARVRSALALPRDHRPLYLVPVGRPARG